MFSVLVVIGSMHPNAGGPPRVVAGSAVALKRAGIDVEIAAIGAVADYDVILRAWPELAECGIPVHLYQATGPRSLGLSIGLRRFANQQARRFNAVHIHGVWEMALGDVAQAARKAGKPTLISPHGMLDRWQMKQSRWKKRLALVMLRTGPMLQQADAILYGTFDEAKQADGLRLPGRVMAMPNGVDPIQLPAREAVIADVTKRWPQVANWSRTVLFFSRLHPKKGLDMLVEAMERVGAEYPGSGLLAVAIPQDDEYEGAIRKRIADIGDSRIVLITDMVGPDARAVFAAADIFVLPSHQEGFSIAILEAMSAGLPVLITDQCHLAEVEKWNVGRVVLPTVDGLVEGLRNLLAQDDNVLLAMGRAAKDRTTMEFSWDRIACRLSKVYNELASAA